MKIGLIVTVILLLSLLGCKVQKGIIYSEYKIFNTPEFNSKYSEVALFNLKNEPTLLDTIKFFKRKNKNEKLEDNAILAFLELQKCSNKDGIKFIDYPNELQSIFDFFLSLSKEEMTWINDKDLKILKNSSIRFIVNYAKEGEALEYLKNELDSCKKDKEFARFVMRSSNLNECLEKR